MSDTPLVSVVMSVLNDELYAAATLDSVLSQEGVEFELIVIDDGSTDRTGEILDDYAARDPRLRVVHQENTGLTRALIRGCRMARGKYIARQDGGGDVSLPGRLRTQLEFLESHPDVVMTSCGTRFMGPEREELYEVVQFGDELQRGLEQLQLGQTQGPSCHCSTMFRRSTYLEVGGYRTEFPIGQDSDLWLRIAEMGSCLATPKVLYEARLSPNSISSISRAQQQEAGKLIISCARLRRCGSDDRTLLENASKLSREKRHNLLTRALQNAQFYYFIASVISKKDAAQARIYYMRSIQSCPFFLRSLIKWLLLEFEH